MKNINTHKTKNKIKKALLEFCQIFYGSLDRNPTIQEVVSFFELPISLTEDVEVSDSGLNKIINILSEQSPRAPFPGYAGKTVNLDLNVLNSPNTTLVLSIRLRKKHTVILALVAKS